MKTPVKTNNEIFDKFWSEYPRKEGKPKALRFFEKNKITVETLDKILYTLKKQAKIKDWEHINIKYIPMPLTWLNRRDWEDCDGRNTKSNDDNPKNQYGAIVCRFNKNEN